MTINLTDPANHPANGPLTVERIACVRDELKRSLQYQNGSDMAYVITDAIKGLEELLMSRELSSKPYGYVHKAIYEQSGSCGLSNDHETYADSDTHIALYTAPPSPQSSKMSGIMPDYEGVAMTQRECYMAGKEAGLAEARKSPVLAVPETLPCPVFLEPGLHFGKGVKTQLLFDALKRRAEYYAELDAMTPEQRAEHDAGIAEFKAMLSGNSPATTDCWCRTCRPVTMTEMRFVVCPDCGNKRCPHANDHRNACTGSNEPGQEGGAYPAAAKEVKSALEMGMSRYGDAMQELAKREVKS